ncbi:hypothetical protein NW759_17746 [Fusarium solani]|nr:hypothetical protein NW759_17746 [Fusarium solani]
MDGWRWQKCRCRCCIVLDAGCCQVRTYVCCVAYASRIPRSSPRAQRRSGLGEARSARVRQAPRNHICTTLGSDLPNGAALRKSRARPPKCPLLGASVGVGGFKRSGVFRSVALCTRETSPPSPLSSPSNEMWPRLVRPAGLTIVGRQLDKRAFKPRRWSRLVAKAQYRVQGLGTEGCMLIDWAAGLTLAHPSERWSVVSPARCFAVCALVLGRQRRCCTAVSRHIETRDGQSDEEGVSGRLVREKEKEKEKEKERDRRNCCLPFAVYCFRKVVMLQEE